jgi:hypothetical protein
VSDLGRLIREQLKEALKRAAKEGPTNVAIATNVGGEGHTTSVYSDDEVTIIERDGHTEVIRKRGEEPPAGET